MKRVYTKLETKEQQVFMVACACEDDIRIEANGCLDELNAVIGIVRSMLAAKMPGRSCCMLSSGN